MKKKHLFYSIFCLFPLLWGCSPDQHEEFDQESNNLSLGASASDFLGDDTFTSLIVEVVYVTGYAPDENTLRELRYFLEQYLHKPDGISFITRAIPAPDMGAYSLSEIKQIEEDYRSRFSAGQKLAAFVFFADEKSESSTDNKIVLGKAYRNTSVVIFQKSVKQLASYSVGVSEEAIEQTTLRHEFGHLLGLVNSGSPAQSPHEDDTDGGKGHCKVEGCLMEASLEFGHGSVDLLQGKQQLLDFDHYCRLDLKANGGK